MWDLQLANPLGRLSMRKLLTFVAALVVTIFGYILLNPSSALAADANWKDQYIQYDGKSFVAQSAAGQNDSRQIPAGDKVYMQVDTPTPTGTGGTLSQKAYTINFAANTDVTKEFSATYTEYSFVPPDTFTNPSNRKTISVGAQPQAQNGNQASGCAIEGGLSWIICPLTTTLANGMDWVFGVLRSFLEVKPLQSNQQNTLYKTWDYMRAFANVAFIIGFLIIIYSQLTSTGISNYGVKKLLPRLIVAAILVNVSYYLCSIAVDLSNILGQSIQSLFISVRNALSGATNDGWNVTSWSSITGFILSGGAVIGAGAISFKLAAVALSGAAGGAIYLILPALLAGILAVLLVIVVLATRQALIIILIILSPLAMVAYLLPNTEKWFEKWRDLLMTMLIMFPAFSLIFGGSQLAGELIIQNSTSIVMLILGLAVQVAPLFITPILFKLSGSLLGRIAGMINNPNKGLVDRTKNWANDRLAEKNALEMRKNHQMAKDGTLRRRNAFRRSALNSDVRKRNREGLKSVNETTANALFAGSDEGLKLHRAEHIAHQLKETTENAAKIHVQQEINMKGSQLHLDNVKLEASKLSLDDQTGRTAADIEEYRSGRVATTGELATFANAIHASNESIAINGMRKKSAEDATKDDFSNKFIARTDLQDEAGGVGGKIGSEIALANAINTQVKAYNDNMSAAKSISTHFKLTVEDKFNHAMDNSVPVVGTDSNGNTKVFTRDDIFTREAAIEDTVKAAPYSFGAKLISESHRVDFTNYRETIAAAMEAGNWEGKGSFYDGETRDMMKQGRVDETYLKNRAAEFLVNGKLSPDSLVSQHKNSLNLYIDVANDMKAGRIAVADDKYAAGFKDALGHGDLGKALKYVKTNAEFAHTDVRMKPRVGDRKDALETMDSTF